MMEDFPYTTWWLGRFAVMTLKPTWSHSVAPELPGATVSIMVECHAGWWWLLPYADPSPTRRLPMS